MISLSWRAEGRDRRLRQPRLEPNTCLPPQDWRPQEGFHADIYRHELLPKQRFLFEGVSMTSEYGDRSGLAFPLEEETLNTRRAIADEFSVRRPAFGMNVQRLGQFVAVTWGGHH